ncbi:glycoside hydrolase family 5 protein [uncultured Ruminococcus sp.]|uniref:glycoside hydrolase family 5 protein n=1 Tax=uncultured Ruminococcus sp. TaxID=165186 RepID=UPI0025CE5509|nr:glycoside hydrolase family 5 protein [uncultured Ruminococcus sp.]
MNIFRTIRTMKSAGALVCAAVLACTAFTACSNTSDSSAAKSSSAASSENGKNDKTAKGEMRDISSMELCGEMQLCWNLGNTLDVCNADRDGDGQIDENSDNVDETLWGNVMTTPEIFETLKSQGFNAVRIPVTWRDHIDENYTIDEAWMDRVQEVVDYAYDLDMYVIINVHHDGGGDPEFGAWIRETAENDYDSWYKEYSTIWTQICSRFENYSDKLIFESMNEVGFDDLNTNKAYELLNKMNQSFVDLVRSTGGNNPQRHLLIAGYWTDIDKTVSRSFKMPTDPQNRCIVSVHYYTPWEFCVCENQYEWGTDAETDVMKNQINKLKTTFIDNGIPVIIGEYGTGNNEKASVIYFDEMLTKLTHDIGIPVFLWDNGAGFNRSTLQWNDPDLLTALQRAVSGEDYEVTKG